MRIGASGRAVLGTIVLLAVLGAPGAVTAADDNSKRAGTFARFPPEATAAFPELFQGSPFESRMLNGTLLYVPGAGQLWQVFRSTAAGRSGVLVRDSRHLDVIGSFTVDTLLQRATFSAGYGGEWLHAVDGGRRVFLTDHRRRLLEVDTVTLAVREAGTLSVADSGLGLSGLEPLVVGGMAWDPVAEKLLVLYGGPPNSSAANRLTVLQSLDPATGTTTDRVVRSCTGPLAATDFTGETYATAPLPSADAVHVPCQRDPWAPGLGLLSSSIVVRLPRASLADADGEEAAVVAGGPMDSALLDPAAGRITVLGARGSLTVVDTATMAVVGSLETAPSGSEHVGAGLDPLTGRVFFQSELGLGHFDARGETLPAPTLVPETGAEGQERILVVGNRVLVLPGHGNGKPQHYTVHRLVS